MINDSQNYFIKYSLLGASLVLLSVAFILLLYFSLNQGDFDVIFFLSSGLLGALICIYIVTSNITKEIKRLFFFLFAFFIFSMAESILENILVGTAVRPYILLLTDMIILASLALSVLHVIKLNKLSRKYTHPLFIILVFIFASGLLILQLNRFIISRMFVASINMTDIDSIFCAILMVCASFGLGIRAMGSDDISNITRMLGLTLLFLLSGRMGLNIYESNRFSLSIPIIQCTASTAYYLNFISLTALLFIPPFISKATEKKEISKEHSSLNIYKDLLETSSMIFAWLDGKFNVKWINRAAEEQTGYHRNLWLKPGAGWLGFVYPPDIEKVRKLMTNVKALNSKCKVNARFIMKNRKIKYLELTCFPLDVFANDDYFGLILRNITPQVKKNLYWRYRLKKKKLLFDMRSIALKAKTREQFITNSLSAAGKMLNGIPAAWYIKEGKNPFQLVYAVDHHDDFKNNLNDYKGTWKNLNLEIKMMILKSLENNTKTNSIKECLLKFEFETQENVEMAVLFKKHIVNAPTELLIDLLNLLRKIFKGRYKENCRMRNIRDGKIAFARLKRLMNSGRSPLNLDSLLAFLSAELTDIFKSQQIYFYLHESMKKQFILREDNSPNQDISSLPIKQNLPEDVAVPSEVMDSDNFDFHGRAILDIESEINVENCLFIPCYWWRRPKAIIVMIDVKNKQLMKQKEILKFLSIVCALLIEKNLLTEKSSLISQSLSAKYKILSENQNRITELMEKYQKKKSAFEKLVRKKTNSDMDNNR